MKADTQGKGTTTSVVRGPSGNEQVICPVTQSSFAVHLRKNLSPLSPQWVVYSYKQDKSSPHIENTSLLCPKLYLPSQNCQFDKQAENTFPTQGHVVPLPLPILLEGQLFPCGPNPRSVYHLPRDPAGKQNSEGKPQGT